MEFYVNQSVCKNHLFSPSCFTDGHEAESTFGMVKRRFAPWRLYSSAECASLNLNGLLVIRQIDNISPGKSFDISPVNYSDPRCRVGD